MSIWVYIHDYNLTPQKTPAGKIAAAMELPRDFLCLIFGGQKNKEGTDFVHFIWLVVSTPLKNVSQIGSFRWPNRGENKKYSIWNHQLDFYVAHTVTRTPSTNIKN